MSRQHDHRDARAGGDQMSHEVEAAHSGHSHIEHHAAAADTISTGRLQEGFRRLERLDEKADRHQEIPEGATQRRVIVHDADHPLVVRAHV